MTIQERLNRIKFVDSKVNLTGLSQPERLAVRECVFAARFMDKLLTAQMGGAADFSAWRRKKRPRSDDAVAEQYYRINYGPWDHFADDEPFLPGVGQRPKGVSFYPKDLTAEEWRAWLATHPQDRDQFESCYTIIRKDGRNKTLRALPYSTAWSAKLRATARHLKDAAAHLPNIPLRIFLEMRAQALLSNDYRASDIAWVKTDGFPFEVTIGPYEVYEDKLLGLKSAFTAYIGIPDKTATQNLQRFAKLLPEYDAILAARLGYKPKGGLTPMVVTHDVFRAGDAHCGRQFQAYNLPNDRSIHEEVGSKKVFSTTMMQAKFEHLAKPIAERILTALDAGSCDFASRQLFILAHELAHGMGPGTIEQFGRMVSIEKLFGDVHSAMEEAKADCLGIAFLNYLHDHQHITAQELAGALTSTIASFFVSWRMGFSEAHSAGELMQYNWLRAADAIVYDSAKHLYRIIPQKALPAYEKLAITFMEIQNSGDYAQAKAFIDKWSKIPPEIPITLKRLEDLPIEVYPIFHRSFWVPTS